MKRTRKTTKTHRPSEDLHASTTPLHQALSDLVSSNVTEVNIRVALYHPKKIYQVTARFRDAREPWVTQVGVDPALALARVLQILQKSPPDRQGLSTAVYHQSKEAATEVANTIQGDPDVLQTKVEFEPNRGWVVVAFFVPQTPPPGHLVGRVEFRELVPAPYLAGMGPATPDEDPETPAKSGRRRRRRRGRVGPTSEDGTRPSPAVSGGRVDRSGWSKKQMEDEYKKRHGKFPDRNIKKADLLAILEKSGF